MSEANLGERPDENSLRDAVHVALVPMIAGGNLYPGQKFKLKYGTKNVALAGEYSNNDEWVGIVDPFLSGWSVEKGQMFWGVLRPNTVTGMRHHWKHPVFDEIVEEERVTEQLSRSDAEIWIRNFCDEWNFDYDELIHAATSTGNWVVANGIDLHSSGELGEDHDLFWANLEVLMDRKFDKAHRGSMGWSCSC